jgi:diaminopimelate decarboxylase
MTVPFGTLQQALEATLRRTAEPLPPEAILALVEPHMARRTHYLSLAGRHGSPLYLFDETALLTRARRLQAAFGAFDGPVNVYYALKSNHYPQIAATLVAEVGFGLDVSSGAELEMALAVGANDIMFSGPGKTAAELDLTVTQADRVTVLLDSFGELERLERIAAGRRCRMRCGVRLSAQPHGLWRKFGIAVDTLGAFWQRAEACPHIDLKGLQFHTSWNLSPAPQIKMIEDLGTLLDTLSSERRACIDFIDIGGGYWPEEGEWLHLGATPAGRLREALGSPASVAASHRRPAADIESFAKELGEAVHEHLLKRHPCRICIEPGRWLSHGAMHLLLQVVDKKAPDLVITDAGTNAIGWERFESDYFPVLNLSQPALSEQTCSILGALCTPHDVWGYYYFGAAIEVDDILLIPNQGAYTYSLRQNFIKGVPTVISC